jgi:hypothetical protein
MKAKAKAVIGRWAVQKGTDRMEVRSVYTCRTPSFFLCIPFPQYIHSVSSPFLLQSSQRPPYIFVVYTDVHFRALLYSKLFHVSMVACESVYTMLSSLSTRVVL